MDNFAYQITYDGTVRKVFPENGLKFDVTELWQLCNGYVDARQCRVNASYLAKDVKIVFAASPFDDSCFNEMASDLLGVKVYGNILLYWGYRTFLDDIKEMTDKGW